LPANAHIESFFADLRDTHVSGVGVNGGPIQTQEQVPDYSKLTLEGMLQLDELQRKALGLPTADEEHHVTGGDGPYTRKWYAAQLPTNQG
jgi:hypothetical protein